MKDDIMNMSSGLKHGLNFGATAIIVGIAWGVLSTKVDALEDDEKKTAVEIRLLQSDVNKQAVTIGQIQITVKNIEKSMEKSTEAQQRLLEQILRQLPPNN